MQELGDGFTVDFDEVFATIKSEVTEGEGHFSDFYPTENAVFDACVEQVGSYAKADPHIVARGELESNPELNSKQESAEQLAGAGSFLEEMAAGQVDHFNFFAESPVQSPKSQWQNMTSPLPFGPRSSHTLSGFANRSSHSPVSAHPDFSHLPSAPFSHWTPPEVDCNFIDSFPLDTLHQTPSFREASYPPTPTHGRIGSFHISVPYPPKQNQRDPYSIAGLFPTLNLNLNRNSGTRLPINNRIHDLQCQRSSASTRLMPEAWAANDGANPYECAERSPQGDKGRFLDCGFCNRTVEQEWREKFDLRAPVTTPRGRVTKLCDACVIDRQIIHSNGKETVFFLFHHPVCLLCSLD